MADIALTVERRSVLGKKVAKLRRGGITPANVFGRNLTSQSIQIPTLELAHTLRAAGRTRLISINLDGEAEPRMVLVRQVSRKPTTDQLLHVDFYQVSMTEKTTVEIPIVLVGTSPIAASGDGLVIQLVSSLAVDCLPMDIPDRIEADISGLTDMHSAVHVSDLKLPFGVTTATDPAEMVIGVSAKTQEEEPEAAAAEEAGEEAEAAGETREESTEN